MFGTQNLVLFITTGLLLNITPGPDTFYILGRSISQGRRAGIASALGISAGCLFHTLVVSFGLAALLTRWPFVFKVIQMAGAAYLICLGVGMFPAQSKKTAGSNAQSQSSWVIFRQGILTNILNPKVALFFLAFLPQFVAPEVEQKFIPLLFLGLVFIFNGTLWCLFLAIFASALSHSLREASSRTIKWLHRGLATLLIGLGIKLALTR